MLETSFLESLPKEMQNEIEQSISDYIDLLDEYRKYDDYFLRSELERSKNMPKDSKRAEIYFAAREILKQRSVEKRLDSAFSKNQATLITLFTGILALCSILTILIKIL